LQEAGTLDVCWKAGRVAVQLLHALLHLRKMGTPSLGEDGQNLLCRAKKLNQLCRSLLEHLKVRVVVEGSLPKNGMLVTNHVSFLDIMFLGALHPMVFVSKSEVAAWPLVGDIASCTGTVYVERSRKADVSRVNQALSHALDAGVLVTLFPEGTSSDGSSVLPFQPSLLQPAVDARINVAPGYLEYLGADGSYASDISYYGDRELAPCLLSLLKHTQLTASLRCGETIPAGLDRKRLTAQLHAEVLRLQQGGRTS